MDGYLLSGASRAVKADTSWEDGCGWGTVYVPAVAGGIKDSVPVLDWSHHSDTEHRAGH